jgi:hypothetical protein
MVAAGHEAVGGAIGAHARKMLGDAFERVRPDAARDAHGYVVQLEDNLLPAITRGEIEEAFGAGAGQELEGKMRAPWSSSALAVNSFARWHRDSSLLKLSALSGFTDTIAFEAKCPNGVSRIPPHLDVLLERGDEIVAVESKCTEYLAAKTAKVSAAYLALREQGDERARSRWFDALAKAPSFRLLDAYQLVKHFLGLALTYGARPLTLVYLYWEPSNADDLPVFAKHRAEVDRFRELVVGDEKCAFAALSYPEHWRELDRLAEKPSWLDAHLVELRRRYEVEI